MTNWYVGRLLFFFVYAFDEAGSFYTVLEVMNNHSAASHSPCIPTVVPFKESEVKKIVVIDIADIVTVVGLLKVVNQVSSGNRVTFEETNSFFVISPSTCFDDDMKKKAGKISNLC
jgi:hypothetical protein